MHQYVLYDANLNYRNPKLCFWGLHSYYFLAEKLNLNWPYSQALPQRPKFKFNFPAMRLKIILAGFLEKFAFSGIASISLTITIAIHFFTALYSKVHSRITKASWHRYAIDLLPLFSRPVHIRYSRLVPGARSQSTQALYACRYANST